MAAPAILPPKEVDFALDPKNHHRTLGQLMGVLGMRKDRVKPEFLHLVETNLTWMLNLDTSSGEMQTQALALFNVSSCLWSPRKIREIIVALRSATALSLALSGIHAEQAFGSSQPKPVEATDDAMPLSESPV